MSLPVRLEDYLKEESEGAQRAARLMRALGSAAAGVWSELSPEEAARLNRALPAEDEGTPADIASAFLDAYNGEPALRAERASVWDELDRLEPSIIARALELEHPQLIATVLSRLSPNTAAQLVRHLPREIATETLRRLMSLGRVRKDVLSLIEQAMTEVVQHARAGAGTDGIENVARIFDGLDTRAEQSLMASLDKSEPGSASRIRALMFTFDDLASLEPAAIQTILSSIDRAVLAIALKGARTTVRDAFLANMTKRAGELLVSEISATGPVRRSEIESARRDITSIARSLAKRGDILSSEPDEDELIE